MKKPALLIVVIVLLVGLAGFLVYRQNQLEQRLDSQQKAAAAALEEQQREAEEAKRPKYEHRSDVLASGEVIVVPNQPGLISVVADTSTMKDIRLTGRFVASGGNDNGIEAFVFDQDNYINWANRHDAQSIYQSGVVTVGDIDLSLNTPGRYFVVFSGRKNFVQRVVRTDVKLDYEKRIN